MYPVALTGAQMRLYTAALSDNHEIRIQVTVLDMEENPISTISNTLLDGQVDVDGSGEVTRSASLQLLDPDRSLNFDSKSPADGALYLDRMIQVRYGVKVKDVGWVDVPVITGPIVKMDRSNDVVALVIKGKESLSRGPIWRPVTFKKGMKITDACEQIMRYRAGETNFGITDLPYKLTADLSLGPRNTAWGVTAAQIGGLARQWYYDGNGTLRMRSWPGNTLYDFKTGYRGNILTPPQISFDLSNVFNTVQVTGGIRRGVTSTDNDPKTRPPTVEAATVKAVAHTPAAHPLSARNLGRNGVDRYIVKYIDDSGIIDPSLASDLARMELSRSLLQEVSASFDALVVPHLDHGDIVRMTTDEFSLTFRLDKFSIPLTAKSPMAIGHNRRVSVSRRRVRR